MIIKKYLYYKLLKIIIIILMKIFLLISLFALTLQQCTEYNKKGFKDVCETCCKDAYPPKDYTQSALLISDCKRDDCKNATRK